MYVPKSWKYTLPKSAEEKLDDSLESLGYIGEFPTIKATGGSHIRPPKPTLTLFFKLGQLSDRYYDVLFDGIRALVFEWRDDEDDVHRLVVHKAESTREVIFVYRVDAVMVSVECSIIDYSFYTTQAGISDRFGTTTPFTPSVQ